MLRFIGVENEHEPMTANDEFIEVCQRILKREWDVLKEEVRSVVNETQ